MPVSQHSTQQDQLIMPRLANSMHLDVVSIVAAVPQSRVHNFGLRSRNIPMRNHAIKLSRPCPSQQRKRIFLTLTNAAPNPGLFLV